MGGIAIVLCLAAVLMAVRSRSMGERLLRMRRAIRARDQERSVNRDAVTDARRRGRASLSVRRAENLNRGEQVAAANANAADPPVSGPGGRISQGQRTPEGSLYPGPANSIFGAPPSSVVPPPMPPVSAPPPAGRTSGIELSTFAPSSRPPPPIAGSM